MRQNYGKSEHGARLIQYAIDIFDLVEIVPAENVVRSISRRFLQPDASLVTRYANVGVKREARTRALALNSRVC